MDAEQMISTRGAELCVQTVGAATDPVVLLIAGMASSMDWWEVGFCERLAATGRRVVRYDQRDTGRSSSWPVGHPGYTFADLVDDAVAVLDHLQADRAHVVGLSMGGAVAQAMAMDHPERVITLTLASTAPIAEVAEATPGMSARLTAYETAPRPDPDWTDRAEVVEFVLADLHAYAGSVRFDDAAMRALVGQVFDRTTDFHAGNTNHMAMPDEVDPPERRMSMITTPTLVLHGTEDPLFSPPTGEILARAITGARFVPLVGVGHEYPPPTTWDQVVKELARHTGGA